MEEPTTLELKSVQHQQNQDIIDLKIEIQKLYKVIRDLAEFQVHQNNKHDIAERSLGIDIREIQKKINNLNAETMRVWTENEMDGIYD